MSEKVTRLEVARFLDHNVGRFRCEVCGSDAFGLVSDPSQETVGLVAERPGGPLQSVNACVIYCKKCGNMKLFLQQHIANWVKANPL